LGALVIVLIVAFGLALLPQMWVKSVLRRHAAERAEFPGSGGEFARHLLDEMNLTHVKVEETTKLGDHYDPEAKAVRLTTQNFDGRSLTAIVVAAHEVGHAMQDATNYRPLHARVRLAKQAQSIERLGMGVMLATPLVVLIFKSPYVVVLELFLGMLILGSTVVMHAMTLPVEFDASFRRALPVLKAGRYIGDRDVGSARQILTAAAFTYVAAAAMSLLDVMRWLRLLRL
jgi:Zn-dependent membrane protease YugP